MTLQFTSLTDIYPEWYNSDDVISLNITNKQKSTKTYNKQKIYNQQRLNELPPIYTKEEIPTTSLWKRIFSCFYKTKITKISSETENLLKKPNFIKKNKSWYKKLFCLN